MSAQNLCNQIFSKFPLVSGTRENLGAWELEGSACPNATSNLKPRVVPSFLTYQGEREVRIQPQNTLLSNEGFKSGFIVTRINMSKLRNDNRTKSYLNMSSTSDLSPHNPSPKITVSTCSQSLLETLRISKVIYKKCLFRADRILWHVYSVSFLPFRPT